MRKVLLSGAIACAILAACSDEQPAPRSGQTLIQTNPIIEVKAELAKDPKNADAWYHLADLYERAGSYAEEVEALQKVIELDPARATAYAKLGTAFNRLGKYPDAVVQFQKAVKLSPRNALTYNNMAFAYGKTGRTDEQIAALRQAIAIRPSYATARYNLGMAYLKKKDREQAMQQYTELKKIDELTAESLKKEIEGRNRK